MHAVDLSSPGSLNTVGVNKACFVPDRLLLDKRLYSKKRFCGELQGRLSVIKRDSRFVPCHCPNFRCFGLLRLYSCASGDGNGLEMLLLGSGILTASTEYTSNGNKADELCHLNGKNKNVWSHVTSIIQEILMQIGVWSWTAREYRARAFDPQSNY